MAKCEICNKGAHFGNAVSHSNRKTSKTNLFFFIYRIDLIIGNPFGKSGAKLVKNRDCGKFKNAQNWFYLDIDYFLFIFVRSYFRRW